MITCAIIDDEPLAIKLLETYISKLDNLNLVSSHSNPLEGLANLKSNPVDLLFLDIQMPEISGIELAKILPDFTKIIFTTAYPNYAVKGFELKALDYLVKPISLLRFMQAVERIQETTEQQSSTPTIDQDYIFVKTEHRKMKIDLDEISEKIAVVRSNECQGRDMLKLIEEIKKDLEHGKVNKNEQNYWKDIK